MTTRTAAEDTRHELMTRIHKYWRQKKHAPAIEHLVDPDGRSGLRVRSGVQYHYRRLVELGYAAPLTRGMPSARLTASGAAIV